jgi:hypothetical protein
LDWILDEGDSVGIASCERDEGEEIETEEEFGRDCEWVGNMGE